MTDTLDRLKVLVNSSTPIVVMETSEETRAINMVRMACSALNMATFEWSIADGLQRCGSAVGVENQTSTSQSRSAPTNVWNQVRVPHRERRLALAARSRIGWCAP